MSIITLTKQPAISSPGAASPSGAGAPDIGSIQGFEGRGYFVPRGYTVKSLLEASRCLERQFDVPSYLAPSMAASILFAAGPATEDFAIAADLIVQVKHIR